MYKSECVDLDCLKLSQRVNTWGNMFKIAKESAKLDVKMYCLHYERLTCEMFYLMILLDVKIVVCLLTNDEIKTLLYFLKGVQLYE